MNDEIRAVPEGAQLIIAAEPITVRVPEAAKMLGVSEPKIYELTKRADFGGAFKFGGCTLISVEALRDWVRAQCGTGQKNTAPLLAQRDGKAE